MYLALMITTNEFNPFILKNNMDYVKKGFEEYDIIRRY